MPEREDRLKDNIKISNDGWGNGLGLRTAKNSVKTVFFNFKEYLSFFTQLAKSNCFHLRYYDMDFVKEIIQNEQYPAK